MEPTVKLSASRVKCANECSWKYYCKYVLKIPDESNDGAKRGSVTHAVLECLQRRGKPRREGYVDKILKTGDSFIIPSIERMVRSQAHHYDLDLTDENTQMIRAFIFVGLKFDFFLDGFDLQDPELAFDHTENSDSTYRMIGFIDKHGVKDGHARIVDYKTSKSKFSDKELGFNIQALMYILYMKKKYPTINRVDCDFLFLKFSQKPLQRITLEGDKLELSLKGVEEYLHYMDKLLSKFDLDSAMSNFAADNYETKWLCGRNPKAWKCPYRNKVKYYVLVDSDGNDIKSSKNKEDFNPVDGQTIKTRMYSGCPKFHWENKS